MGTVKDLLARKGNEVFTVSCTASVLDATRHMSEKKVGALLVLGEDAVAGQIQIAGMFTERDVLRRVVVPGLDPAATTVAQAMTPEVFVCSPSTPIPEVALLIKEHRVRHVPVCDGEGTLVGMVSIGDINAYHVRDQELTISTLETYIYGRV